MDILNSDNGTATSESATTLWHRAVHLSDRSAWEQLLNFQASVIVSWGKSRGLQQADAEDLAQDAIHNAIRSIYTYDRKKGRFSTWLFAIVRNAFLKLLKSNGRAPLATGDTDLLHRLEELPAPAPDADWNEEFDWQLMEAAFTFVKSRVAETTWQAFWLTQMEGRPPAEVAAQLNIGAGAVYVYKSRVLSQLSNVIRELEGEL